MQSDRFIRDSVKILNDVPSTGYEDSIDDFGNKNSVVDGSKEHREHCLKIFRSQRYY